MRTTAGMQEVEQRRSSCRGAAIARLAALVPRPRLNLTRFHGIFAPNFKHRHQIVPCARGRVDDDQPLAPMNWAQRLQRVFAIDIGRSRTSCPSRHRHIHVH